MPRICKWRIHTVLSKRHRNAFFLPSLMDWTGLVVSVNVCRGAASRLRRFDPMASLSTTFNADPTAPRFSVDKSGNNRQQQQIGSLKIGNSRVNFARRDDSQLLKFGLTKRKPVSLREASKESCRLGELKDHEKQTLDEKECGQEPFEDLKHRFLSFKRKNFLENRIHYENLSEGQAPKFMVIACADSRVCPSRVLGFQLGEAFTVRNVSNLVPPFQHGSSETSAALEFAVNSLEVANVLVVGHSRCGGIQALMSMKDEGDSRNQLTVRC